MTRLYLEQVRRLFDELEGYLPKDRPDGLRLTVGLETLYEDMAEGRESELERVKSYNRKQKEGK
jgi:hypothetical protein